MSERTPVPADHRFRHAVRLICTACRTRLHTERHGLRVRLTLEQLADEHSRAAIELIIGV